MSRIEQRDMPARGEGTMGKTLWIDGKGETEILAAGATGTINLIQDIMRLRDVIEKLRAALAAVDVRNQHHGCQGCQAGWPVRDVFGVDMHVVIGGYIGEVIMCVESD